MLELSLYIILGIAIFAFLINEKKISAKVEERKRKKAFQKTMEQHPEWAASLNSDTLEEQKKLEKEKKDREEFERLAKEHPEWL